MKKLPLATLAAALLLLSACSGSPAPSPSPSAPADISPAPSQTSTATAEPMWWETARSTVLPDQTGTPVSVDGVDCYLLATLEDTRLYCGLAGEDGGYLLLRQDEALFLPAPMEQLPETSPKLQPGDFDGDGSEELLLLCYDQPQAAQLYLCRWADGWTVHAFSSTVYNPLLLEALEYRFDSDTNTATVTCYGEQVDYSLGAGESGQPDLHRDFSGLVFYRVSDETITAVFGVGLELEGSVRYIANLTADVIYDGADFSLENFQLVATGGV